MPDMKQFNEGVIKDFRANRGKVGGPWDPLSLLLVTMKGARLRPALVDDGAQAGP